MRSVINIWRAVLCVLVLTTSTWAAEGTLRWQFTPGDSQLYRMTQTAEIELSQSVSNDLKAKIQRVFDFEWRVESVDDEGTALVAVDVKRVRIHVDGPGGQETHCDTASEEPPRGFAATMLPLFNSLVELELKATMNARGELSDLQIPEDIQIALSSKPPGKALGQIGSEKDIRFLFQLGVPTLPEDEAFAEGQQWETEQQLADVEFGSPTIKTVYRWEATVESDGDQVAVIQPSISLQLEDVGERSARFASDYGPAGELRFNLSKGRLDSSDVVLQLGQVQEPKTNGARGEVIDRVVFEPLDESELP